MAEQRTYPHGVTCWVDSEQPDLDAASRFYAGLFGWTLTDAMPPDAPGSYLIATLDGQDVAALGPATGSTAIWNTYVAVDDADATAAAVPGAGGSVVAAPEDAGPGGRAAVCTDPAGAEFRLWQARQRLGAQLTNAPGTWNFSDLYTPDPDAAMAFYTPLFGWVAADMEQDAGTMLQVPGYGDHLAATVDPGIHERQAAAPPGFADVIGSVVIVHPGEPARWHVTFTVADRDGQRRHRRGPRRHGAAVSRRAVDAQRSAARPPGRRVHGQPVHSAGRRLVTAHVSPRGHGDAGLVTGRHRRGPAPRKYMSTDCVGGAEWFFMIEAWPGSAPPRHPSPARR